VTVQSQPTEAKPTIDGGHVEVMPVHFDDLDAMGFVHNSRYAIMLERALTAFWERNGFNYDNARYSEPDMFLSVAEYSIKYLLPFRGTGRMRFHIWIDRIGETSVVYRFRALSADSATIHAEGHRVHIRIDPKTLRPTSWTPTANAVMETLLVK
jgi:acyl-CoA thioester hydrolase